MNIYKRSDYNVAEITKKGVNKLEKVISTLKVNFKEKSLNCFS